MSCRTLPFQRALAFPHKRTQHTMEVGNPSAVMAHKQTTLLKSMSDQGRPSSVPPATLHANLMTPIPLNARSSSIPPQGQRHHPTLSDGHSTKDAMGEASLDLMGLLQRSEQSVVKTRSGSVLSRGFILKTDHYPSGMSNASTRCNLTSSFTRQVALSTSVSMYTAHRTSEHPVRAISMFLVPPNPVPKVFEQFYLS